MLAKKMLFVDSQKLMLAKLIMIIKKEIANKILNICIFALYFVILYFVLFVIFQEICTGGTQSKNLQP